MQMELTHRSTGLLRAAFIAAWLFPALAFAVYCIVRTDPHTPSFIPFAQWLDSIYDLRTLIMTAAVITPPALAMASRSMNAQRRSMLIGSTALLVILEVAQLWIPHRTFSQLDLLYTVLPAVMLETGVMLYIESRFE